MGTYSLEVPKAQAPRRQSIRQIAAHALRQTKRLGEADMVLTWEAGSVIGKTLALIGMRRRCMDDIEFDLAIMLEYVLGLDEVAKTPDQRARQALFAAICKEYECAVRLGYDSQAFRFSFDEEAGVMSRGVRKADGIVRRWKAWRERFFNGLSLSEESGDERPQGRERHACPH